MSELGKDAEFVELLSTSQLRLRAFAISLVRNPSDADDILQNACVALWQKRAQYRHDGSFFSWAAGMVYIEVLRYRRRHATEKLKFDEALLSMLAQEYIQQADELHRMRDHLPHCLEKLNEGDRSLIELRYTSGKAVVDIANQLGCPQSTLYNTLARIRHALYECIRSALAREYHPT